MGRKAKLGTDYPLIPAFLCHSVQLRGGKPAATPDSSCPEQAATAQLCNVTPDSSTKQLDPPALSYHPKGRNTNHVMPPPPVFVASPTPSSTAKVEPFFVVKVRRAMSMPLFRTLELNPKPLLFNPST
jgi:hypothetical protein